MTSRMRKAPTEFVGTAFLPAVVGSGLLPPGFPDVGLELLENSLITGAALVALILERATNPYLADLLRRSRCLRPSTRSSPWWSVRSPLVSTGTRPH